MVDGTVDADLTATYFVCTMAATFPQIANYLATNDVAKCNQPVKKHLSELTRVY